MSYLSGIGLAACGRVVLGLPACLPRPRTFACGFVATGPVQLLFGY